MGNQTITIILIQFLVNLKFIPCYLVLLFLLCSCENQQQKEAYIQQLHAESEMIYKMNLELEKEDLITIERVKKVLKEPASPAGAERYQIIIDSLEKNLYEVLETRNSWFNEFENIKKIKDQNEQYEKELESSKKLMTIINDYSKAVEQFHIQIFQKWCIIDIIPDAKYEILN